MGPATRATLQVPATTHQAGHCTLATHSQAWLSQLHRAVALGRALLQWVGAAVAAAAETATTVQSDLDAAPRPLGPAEAPAGGKRARKETGIKIRQRRRRKNGIGERRRIQSGARAKRKAKEKRRGT